MTETIIASGIVAVARVYEPFQLPPFDKAERGFSIALTDWEVQGDTRGYLTQADGQIRFFSKLPITVVPRGDRSLTTLLQCARDRCIPADALLIGTKVRVAVQKVEFNRQRPGSFTRASSTETVKALRPLAVEVDHDLMLARYDDECRRHFGQSYPEWHMKGRKGDAP